MTPRVREILSTFQAEPPSVLNRLAQVFNQGRCGGSGRLVLYSAGDGLESGPAETMAWNPDSFEASYHFKAAIELGVSALVAPLGVLQAGARDFAGEIPTILKLQSQATFQGYSTIIDTGDVESALELGCAGVSLVLSMGADNLAEQVKKVQEALSQARSLGLLTLIEIVREARVEDEAKRFDLPLEQASYGAHLASQLGAQLISMPEVSAPSNANKRDYIDRRIVSESQKRAHEERLEFTMRATFQKSRPIIARFTLGTDQKEREEQLRVWTSVGGYGCDLGWSGFYQPIDKTQQDINEYHKLLIGE